MGDLLPKVRWLQVTGPDIPPMSLKPELDLYLKETRQLLFLEHFLRRKWWKRTLLLYNAMHVPPAHSTPPPTYNPSPSSHYSPFCHGSSVWKKAAAHLEASVSLTGTCLQQPWEGGQWGHPQVAGSARGSGEKKGWQRAASVRSNRRRPSPFLPPWAKVKGIAQTLLWVILVRTW